MRATLWIPFQSHRNPNSHNSHLGPAAAPCCRCWCAPGIPAPAQQARKDWGVNGGSLARPVHSKTRPYRSPVAAAAADATLPCTQHRALHFFLSRSCLRSRSPDYVNGQSNALTNQSDAAHSRGADTWGNSKVTFEGSGGELEPWTELRFVLLLNCGAESCSTCLQGAVHESQPGGEVEKVADRGRGAPVLLRAVYSAQACLGTK
jgi:hypothetical protein